jgi:hypothetical protein
MTNLPEPRDLFRRALTECVARNPNSIEYIVLLMAFYLHVGPFSREVIGRIENMMAALEPSATSRHPAWSSVPTRTTHTSALKLIGDIALRENKETAD